MKRINTFLLAMLLLLPGFCAVAANNELTPSLFLDHIKMIKTSETSGDELYFDVAVYRAMHPTEYVRLPSKPFHEPSKLIGQFSKIRLWSEPLKMGETVTIVVSLIEADDTPLNPDDLIGLVRVKLKNEAGVLQTTWDMPNHSAAAITSKDQSGKVQKFELNGEGSQYEVYLSLMK